MVTLPPIHNKYRIYCKEHFFVLVYGILCGSCSQKSDFKGDELLKVTNG